MSRNTMLQILRGLAANIPVLAVGEFYLATDTKQVYIGTNSGNQLIESPSPTEYQTEIDFGVLPVSEASFTIINSAVTPSSNITGSVAYVAPTGKDLDELEMDSLDLKFGPGNGQFFLYIKGQDGYVADKFKINYVVG